MEKEKYNHKEAYEKFIRDRTERLDYANKNYPIGTKYIPMDKNGYNYPQPSTARFKAQITLSWWCDYHNDIDVACGLIYVHKLNKWAEIVKE